ncbi:WD40 repeat [Dillenia turbinata]|uniref:WD40 repeat n=1 Tax=Dillenia turbinata TaxID=194707 RepID=A0AAN8Z5V7_9MAGN
MMGSCSEVEDCQFFDSIEELTSGSDSCSDFVECSDSISGLDDTVPAGFLYDIWVQSPKSIAERRKIFLEWMGLGLSRRAPEKSVSTLQDMLNLEEDRIVENGGASVGVEDEIKSDLSSVWDTKNDAIQLTTENETSQVAMGLNSSLEVQKLESNPTSSVAVLQQYQRTKDTSHSVGIIERVKKKWLSRLRSMACIVDGQGGNECTNPNECNSIGISGVQKVKVRQSGKKSKELSALFTGQVIQAHKGSILTMKFSPDGQYLASAGEDGIVRLWQIVEDERSNNRDIPEMDPSCVYFAVNHLSELAPLMVDKEKHSTLKSLKKTSDSACVIFPPKVFRILEKPLHEFRGHTGEILDLSWSKNNHLLSSSVDKTVRLWRIGCDHCVKVFAHNNYVTCIQFNPVDDDYFISGSIDGKVRIWAISGCRVVDWTDIKEIITAVCYRLDGKGGIVGSMTGNCRFYNLSDNHLQLDTQICLQSKKKSPLRRITGFQFLPQDPSKVMVTCADSHVRVLHGTNVVGKYKGLRNAGNQMFASFTSDGKHIVSASEDSNVYVWNIFEHEENVISQGKNITSSERFSTDAAVAVPWPGLKHGDSDNKVKLRVLDESSLNTLDFSSATCFSLSQEFFLESYPKGSATWPEEKLPTASPLSAHSTIHKSQYKFFRDSYASTSSSHAWGLVIVTAGWDGQIRSFLNYGLPVPL